MLFLLLQILAYLVLAAVFGACLAYWWLSRSYKDSYASLMEQNDMSTRGLLTKFDLESGLSNLSGPDLNPIEAKLGALEQSIGAIAMPETDLSLLENRLLELEKAVQQVSLPETDLSPLEERLLSLESTMISVVSATNGLKNTDTSRMERQMDVIATAMAERETTDLTPVEARLAGLEDALSVMPAAPDIDLGPIHSGLTRVEMSLANMDFPTPDLSIMESRIQSMQENLAESRTTYGDNREAIDKRLDDIETRIAHIHVPEPDLRSVDEGLSIVHGRLATLEAAVDLAPLQQRIDQLHAEIMRLERMEGTLGTLRMDLQQSASALDPLEQRMELLQRELNKQPTPDFTPVLNSVYAMEQRMDFGAMENRLTSIEYGLAALHHMLRSRQAQTAGNRVPDRPKAPNQTPPSAPPPPAFTAPPQYEPHPYEPPAPSNYTAPQTREPWSDPLPMPPAFDASYEPRRYDYDPTPAASARPAAPVDAIGDVRRPDDKANLLTRPAFGAPDDLEEISGVGPMLHGLLTEIGVFYFWQVAEWGSGEIEWVDDMLDGFNGRIERDDWVGQAKILATGQNAAKRP